MQLGGEKEALEQVQVGALEMTRVSVGVVGPIVDDFNAFNLPYVFRSVDHMHKVVDGEIGTELLNKLEAGGLIGLGYMDAGSRSFYNAKRPIRTIDEFNLSASISFKGGFVLKVFAVRPWWATTSPYSLKLERW